MKIINTKTVKIILGKNAKDNAQMIHKYTSINDNFHWCHASEFPSAHAIICSEKPNRKDIKKACLLIKETNNKLVGIRRLEFDVVKLKHIKPDNKILGLVHLQAEPKIIKI